MLILSIDTSNSSSSVSVVRDGRVLGEIYLNCGLVHSKVMCGVLKSLLNLTSIGLGEINAFAVCSGPGSYTGVRIGVSLLKGLAFSTKKKCVGISSLYALAYLVQGFDKKNVVYSCIKANNEEVYFNSYMFDNKKEYIFPIGEDRFLTFDELSKIIKSEKRQIILVTDNSDFIYKNLIDCMNFIEQIKVGNVKSSSVGILACHQINNNFRYDVNELKPNYLKKVKIDRSSNV